MIRIRRLVAHNFKQLREIDLTFPDIGRFLVQGKNEAGKSTLFEAVYFAIFGEGLATESTRRAIGDLIAYNTEKARVELDLAIGARVFHIVRTIVRGKNNVWELDILDGDQREEIRGNRIVNERIVRELGFDGETLLNTCFVEQKKLEKLEGLGAKDREDSLAKLLNLDAMTRMEDDFKVRAEDRRQLEWLQKRRDLAEIQAELPGRETELRRIEGQLLFLDLKRTLADCTTEQRAVQELEAEIASLAPQRDTLAVQAEQVERVREASQIVREMRSYQERIAEQEREIERLEDELAERARLEAEELPALADRLRRLGLLRSRLNRLARLHDVAVRAEAELASIATARKDIEAKRREWQEAKTRGEEIAAQVRASETWLAALDKELRTADAKLALDEWLAAARQAPPPAVQEAELREKRAEHDRLSRDFRTGLIAFGLAVIASVVIAFGLVIGFIVWQMSIAGIVALGAAFLAVTAILLIVLGGRLINLWQKQTRVTEELGRLEGAQRAVAGVADQQRERVAASEAKLASLGFAVPTTLAEAEKLAARLGGRPIDELRGERDAVRERLAQACALAGEIERIIARLEGEIAAHDEVALSEQEAAWRRRLDKARRITAAWALKAAEIADRLGVAPDTNAVVGLVGRWQGEEQALHRRIAERDDLRRQEAERRKNIDSLRKALAERTSSLQSLAPGLTIDDLASVEQALQACYRELGGDEVSSQLRDIETKIARKQGDLTARGRAIERLIETARGIVAQVNVAEALSSSPTLAEVERLLARLDRLDLGDEETLLEQRERLLGQVGFLRNSKANLERELGLSGNELDIELCRREHEAKVHEHAVREKAVQIVATARRRVVEKVLPSTMEHMRALLPILTLDRYHDAELTEDYKIRVWDERAGDHGAWKEKNIFSGGTKDQFSLALRLAFALATLPAERGTAPSFIFLDEPLGSFDDERAQALLDLLTEGAIARSFDQIFLISHVRVDPSLFTNRITLDAGRVVESDLPDPTLSPLKRGG